MLGVIDQLAAALGDVANALRDHGEVLRARRLDHLIDMERPALPEDRDDRRLSIQQRVQVRVGLWSVRFMTRAAEGGELGALPANLLRRGEELNVLRVRPWPATLNRWHAELIERAGNTELVLQ